MPSEAQSLVTAAQRINGSFWLIVFCHRESSTKILGREIFRLISLSDRHQSRQSARLQQPAGVFLEILQTSGKSRCVCADLMGSYSNRLARSLTLFLSYFLSYFSNHSKYYDYVLFYNISRRKNDFFSPFFFFYFFFDLRTWRPRARTPRG